jgi:hypothetical protein
VLGDEVDLDTADNKDKSKRASGAGGGEGDKAEVEHREVAEWQQAQHAQQVHGDAQGGEDGLEQGRRSGESKKGWKEI